MPKTRADLLQVLTEGIVLFLFSCVCLFAFGFMGDGVREPPSATLPSMRQRLQKILAAAGVASRRKSEELITVGRVAVNGVTASLGDSADPAEDVITFDGQPLLAE